MLTIKKKALKVILILIKRGPNILLTRVRGSEESS